MALELRDCRRHHMFVNMVFSDKGSILIKKLYHLKGYKAVELTNEFPNK